jgi:hypothetical protein
MPCGDGTGPWWVGSRGYRSSGHVNPWCRGIRPGQGFWRSRSFAPSYSPFRQPTPVEERSYLEEAAQRLESDLNAIRERIEKLRSTS